MVVGTEEVRIKGIPISKGVAIGRPFFFTLAELNFPEQDIALDAVEEEVARFRRAVEASKNDVIRLQKKLEKEGISEATQILETHLQMLCDVVVCQEVEEGIRDNKKNAESVFSAAVKRCKAKFLSLPDLFFRERYNDVKDIARRVLGHLCETGVNPLTQVPENSIVVAHELPASDAAEATASTVSAFVTNTGGATSHAAIVAKARGIPCITEVDITLMEGAKETDMIVDGCQGEIILNPSEKTLRRYRRRQLQLESYFKHLAEESDLKAETHDGYSVSLVANVETVGEVDMISQWGGSGVGLFRSEFIFLSKDRLPTEEEQFGVYRSLIEKTEGQPPVIRVFDIGGDKFPHVDSIPEESCNLLGCRSIRFLLKEREIFKTQVRAILKASHYGPVKILFPMVSGLREFEEARGVVKESARELAKEGLNIAEKVPLGCMIELPSAAIMADALAAVCDFFSIGTNDLVQYCLAAERGNPEMSAQYTPAHPAVIRLLQFIVTAGKEHHIPVTVCGEMAADPRFVPLLLGLGIQEFSVALRHLPVVKRTVRSTSIVEAIELAEEVLQLNRDRDIKARLDDHYMSHVPHETADLS